MMGRIGAAVIASQIRRQHRASVRAEALIQSPPAYLCRSRVELSGDTSFSRPYIRTLNLVRIVTGIDHGLNRLHGACADIIVAKDASGNSHCAEHMRLTLTVIVSSDVGYFRILNLRIVEAGIVHIQHHLSGHVKRSRIDSGSGDGSGDITLTDSRTLSLTAHTTYFHFDILIDNTAATAGATTTMHTSISVNLRLTGIVERNIHIQPLYRLIAIGAAATTADNLDIGVLLYYRRRRIDGRNMNISRMHRSR